MEYPQSWISSPRPHRPVSGGGPWRRPPRRWRGRRRRRECPGSRPPRCAVSAQIHAPRLKERDGFEEKAFTTYTRVAKGGVKSSSIKPLTVRRRQPAQQDPNPKKWSQFWVPNFCPTRAFWVALLGGNDWSRAWEKHVYRHI